MMSRVGGNGAKVKAWQHAPIPIPGNDCICNVHFSCKIRRAWGPEIIEQLLLHAPVAQDLKFQEVLMDSMAFMVFMVIHGLHGPPWSSWSSMVLHGLLRPPAIT